MLSVLNSGVHPLGKEITNYFVKEKHFSKSKHRFVSDQFGIKLIHNYDCFEALRLLYVIGAQTNAA